MKERYGIVIPTVAQRQQEGVKKMFNEQEFKACLARVNVTYKQLAKELGINATTLYRKVMRHGDFSRDEINCICDIIGKEYLIPVFFAQKVA